MARRSKRRCPPSVIGQASLPSLAQRLTVLGETPSSRATPARAKSRPCVSVGRTLRLSSERRLHLSPGAVRLLQIPLVRRLASPQILLDREACHAYLPTSGA